jgi:putative oxidoreductase
MNGSHRFIRRPYELLIACANYLQAPLLLFLRVYFFWQLFLTGKGKLLNIERTAEFFGSLGIPMPILNASVAGATECFGGGDPLLQDGRYGEGKRSTQEQE